TLLPRPDAFAALQANSALEALAIDALGRLWTLPERSGAVDLPFPVWRFDGEGWSQPFTLPRADDGFLPVGADFGPDGRLYVLERRLGSVFGFNSRVRRYDVTGDVAGPAELLLETAPGDYDNLEG